MIRRRLVFVLAPSLLVAFGCGGIAVVDDGTGGAGTAGGVSVTHAAAASSTVASVSVSVSSSASGTPGGANLVEVPFGQIAPSTDMSFTSDARTLGITATTKPASDFDEVLYTRLTAPSGALVVDGPLPQNQATWDWQGIASMATPQIDHPETFPLAQGTWTFHVESDSDALASLWVRQTVDGQFHGGIVDVDFFIAGGATDEAHATDAAALAFTDWGGLELGDVRVFTIGDQFDDIDENNVFDALHQTFQAPTRPVLNIIAVDSISGQFAGAAGFATGVPGSPLSNGSTQSAVVWMVQGDDFFDPLILRHEAGHFAGLFHTSEFEAGLGDPLGDTPQCADVNAMMNDCPDFDFAMFPTGGSGVGLFSPHESVVMQGSALYRGVWAPGELPMPPLSEDADGGQAKVASDRVSSAKARAWSLRAAHGRHARAAFASTLGGAPRGSARFDSIASALESIACPVGETGVPDASEVLRVLGLTDPLELLAIAESDRAMPITRLRAMTAASTFAARSSKTLRSEVARRLDAIAHDASVSPVVRKGALGANAPTIR